MSRVVQWQAPSLAVRGQPAFPVRHAWCVGRNYAEHAREMGVDSSSSRPVFFAKPARAVHGHPRVSFPAETQSLHHEVELVVLLADGGRHVPAMAWAERIHAYAVGVDLTRRDVQDRLKKAGQPWEISKGFDQSGPVGVAVLASEWEPSADHLISLQVNGVVRQQAELGTMIWSVPALLERLSAEFTLQAGDVVFTGTPAGVGSLNPGDRVLARVDGLPDLEFHLDTT